MGDTELERLSAENGELRKHLGVECAAKLKARFELERAQADLAALRAAVAVTPENAVAIMDCARELPPAREHESTTELILRAIARRAATTDEAKK